MSIGIRQIVVWTLGAVAVAAGFGCGPGNNSGNDTGTLIVIEEDTGSGGETGTMDTGVCDAGAEVCNGEDDDCDGVVDEGCSCEYSGTSVGVCKAGEIDENGDCEAPPGYSDDEEACDGQDNDCDGVTDETCGCTFKHRAKGVCAEAQIGPNNGACSKPQVYESDESSCDGKDNDCDGIVDEGCNCVHGETRPCYTGPEGTNGFGQCSPGRETCKDGAWSGNCEMEVTPSAEQCDGQDNDCDGEVDEMEIDEGFEGKVAGWSSFSSGKRSVTVSVPHTGVAHSGAASAKAEGRRGICGKAGGVAKDFEVGPNVDEITMHLKADTYQEAIIGVALEDSDGLHQLWRKKPSGGGFDWKMPWTKKTFDISPYDDEFKLIIGNVDDSFDCDDYYHRWTVWVDDIEAGVDCR